jgi:hypothetical protein
VKHLVRHFWFSGSITLIAIIAMLLGRGWAAAGITLVLLVIEVAFSFDNAVINAKVLAKLSKFWQTLFLTVGILIAVVGMRLVFPILLVAVTAGLSWGEVIRVALNDSEAYARYIEDAYPSIAAFGGAFLLMLALYFFFDKERHVHWLPFENHLQRLGHWWLPPIVAFVLLGLLAALPINTHASETLKAGALGVIVYVIMQLILMAAQRAVKAKTPDATHLVGWAAFTSFLYLELLDASFSFDGVIGAFAITTDVVLIAVGLGVGAFWVRSFTVYMVRRKTLDAYAYLEHGAHYAVFFLSMAMLISLVYHLPEAVTGVVTVAIIGASLVASKRLNKVEHEKIAA